MQASSQDRRFWLVMIVEVAASALGGKLEFGRRLYKKMVPGLVVHLRCVV